jgi:hypothetical protein
MSTIVIGTNPVDEDCEVDVRANALFTSLTTDVPTPHTIDFTDPNFAFDPADSDLYTTPGDVNLADLTTVALDGTGVFDVLMSSVDLHINREFRSGRITGDQYADVYVQAMTSVLSNSTQFVLSKDQAKWSAITAQMQARIAEIQATGSLVDLEKTKVEAAKIVFDMKTSGAQYALTKANVANAEAEHCLTEAQVENQTYANRNFLPITLAQEQHKLSQTLPLQSQLIQEQVEKERAQTLDTRTDGLTPVGGILGLQKQTLTLDVSTKQFGLDNTLPAQINILQEQRESERAKTVDTRTDGGTVEGSIGKQKDLYDQQIDSFDKDAKHKTAKMFLDSWITQKTLDEGLQAPDQFTNANVDEVMTQIRTVNNL